MKQSSKPRLKSYFGFVKIPFSKYMWAKQMFDSESQMELSRGLSYWLELKGICVVYGSNGVGKSITFRRFQSTLDEKRVALFYSWNQRLSMLGFLRSLSRKLGLPPKQHAADMFDEVSAHLNDFESKTGRHPVLVFDNAELLNGELLEHIRLLTNFEMDSQDKCSVLIIGTERLWDHMGRSDNQGFQQCVTFSHKLRAFSLDDTRKYFKFHLERAEGPPDTFDVEVIQLIFDHSRGIPRVINQLATQSLIRAAMAKRERIDEAFFKNHVLPHTLYDLKGTKGD